ncbi:MAG: flippase-like domain-containing protein [Caldimicrobium sp.]
MLRYLLLGLILFTLIIGFSFGYLIIKHFPKELPSLIFALNRKNLFLSLLSLFFYHTFDTLRVIIIARALGIKYPLWYGYLVSFVNTFGATITPAHLGGEILPLYTLSRKGGQFYQILTIITMKGISGALFYILMAPFTIKTLFENPKEAKELILIVLSLSALFILGYLIYKIFFKKENLHKRGLLSKFKRMLLRYIVTSKIFFKTKKIHFFLAIFLSLLLYKSFLFIGIFLLKAFNPSVNPLEVFFRQLPLLYAIFISPTPGGSGVGELGALPIFNLYLPEDLLGPFVIIWRFLSQYLSALIGGGLFLVLLMKDVKKNYGTPPI